MNASSLRVQPHPPAKGWIAGEGDLRFELDFLSYLHAKGVPVGEPVQRANGDPLGSWECDQQSFYFSLFAWAPGVVVPSEVLTQSQARRVGETIAKLHHAADDFHTAYPRYQLDISALLDEPLAKLEPAIKELPAADRHFVLNEVADIRRRLEAFTLGPGMWGLVHGDIHSLNFHFTEDGNITLFDFDLCAYGWRAYDVAHYYSRIPLTVRDSALDGYMALRPLGDTEIELLPTFGRAAWVWEGLGAPELVTRLRNPYV